MTESDARRAFNTADAELQRALTKYKQARAALHRITGEFHGADEKLALQFRSATGQLGNDGGRVVADC